MKKDRFLLDVETTGFDKEKDQITEIAAIVEDSDCNIIDKLDLKIRLMENSIPSPGALLVTKINPFTDEWKKEGITPYEAVQKLKKFCQKHKDNKGKLIFTAYNASFDKERIAQLLKVCLEDFEEFFDKSIFDPLNTARKMIEQGKLSTKVKQRKNGGTYQSATLGDVSIALGTITEEKLAGLHRAMEDTELMRLTIHKLYELATGDEMVGLESLPKEYKKGDLVSAVTDLQEQGLKKHILLIDSNNSETEKIVAIDLDHWKKVGLDENAVKEFNYGDFLSSKKVESPKDLESSRKFYERNRSKIHMLINLLNKQEEEAEEKKDYNFSTIEKVEKIMSSSTTATDAKENLLKAKKEINDPENEEEIISLAEQLNLYKGKKGWSLLLGKKLPHMEDDDAKFVEGEVKKEKVKVVMNPAGFYEIYANNKVSQAYTKGDIGPTISQMIEGAPKGGKAIKALEKDLLLIKEFTNPKHPLALKQEIEDTLAEDRDFSDEDKKILTDLVNFYKEKYPKTFSSYNLSFEKEVFNNLSMVQENLNFNYKNTISEKEANIPTLEERINFFNQNILIDKANLLFYTIDLSSGEIFSQFLALDVKEIETLEIQKTGISINDTFYQLTEKDSSERILASEDYPFLAKLPDESMEIIDNLLSLEDYCLEKITFSPKKNNPIAQENLTDIFSKALNTEENKAQIWENIEKSIFSEENALDFLKKRK